MSTPDRVTQTASPTGAPRTPARPPRPGVPAPTVWPFPEPRVTTLANGLTVWAYHLPGQHVVAVDLVFDLPLHLEPRDREGVALLCARVADEGTLRHPGSEITELLELHGAAYSAHVNHDATMLSLDVPDTRLAEAWPLFAEIVRESAFDPADVARHVALRLSEIEQVRANPASVVGVASRRLQYLPDDRRHRVAGGERDTVSTLTAEHLQAFRDAWWRPNRGVLVVAGELPVDLLQHLDRAFGDWTPAGVPAEHPAPHLAAPGARTVHLVDHPDAVQAEVRIVGTAPDRTSPDLPLLQVAADALGGSFLSRLNSVLREDLGYTYGAHLVVSPHRVGGTWAASWSSRTDVTADALSQALAILRLEQPLTHEELADAVNHLVGVAPLHFDTAGSIAQQARALVAAGVAPDYVSRHFAAISSASPDTATALARQVVDAEHAHIVVVGRADALRGPLQQVGFVVQDLAVDRP